MSGVAAPSNYDQRIEFIENRMDRTDKTIESLTNVVNDSVRNQTKNHDELKDIIQKQNLQASVDAATRQAAKGTISLEGIAKAVSVGIAVCGVTWGIISTVIGNDIKTNQAAISAQKTEISDLKDRVTKSEQNFLHKSDIEKQISDSYQRLRESITLADKQIEDLRETSVTTKEIDAAAKMRDALARGFEDRIRRLEEDAKEIRGSIVARGEHDQRYAGLAAADSNLQRQIDATSKQLNDIYGAADKIKELSSSVQMLQREIADAGVRAQKGR